MEILNNTYALANLIRLTKLEQIYSYLQTHSKDIPAERMITMERSLALLASAGQVDSLEAEKWANQTLAFLSELKYLQHPEAPTAELDS